MVGLGECLQIFDNCHRQIDRAHLGLKEESSKKANAIEPKKKFSIKWVCLKMK